MLCPSQRLGGRRGLPHPLAAASSHATSAAGGTRHQPAPQPMLLLLFVVMIARLSTTRPVGFCYLTLRYMFKGC